MKKRTFRLQPGSTGAAPTPIIEITHDQYVWLGNGGPDAQWCFGTLHGNARIRALRDALTALLRSPYQRRRAKAAARRKVAR